MVVSKWADANELHRTAKQLYGSGRAASLDAAQDMLESFVLQIDVGEGIETSAGAQAALLTAVNTGSRAFLGGVAVRIPSDPILTTGWVRDIRLSDAIAAFGGRIVNDLDAHHPTVVVGRLERATNGAVVVYCTWDSWSGGVVDSPRNRLAEQGTGLPGIIAGALGVSEAFQFATEATAAAGRRSAGVSLWRPDLPWSDADARGPDVRWLPTDLWLLGLGHLGQGYAWAWGWLPFADPSKSMLALMDTDHVVKGNLATGLLSRATDIRRRKTRVVAAKLESLGFITSIVERRFDGTFNPQVKEPRLALSGFDDPEPRRLLDGRDLLRAVDAGLGAGHREYLDILVHTFPSELPAQKAFPHRRPKHALAPQYVEEIERQVAAGADEADARCGAVQVAGISVGAAFVGATAGAIAVGDLVRALHAGQEYSVIAFDLGDPEHIEAVATVTDRQVLGAYVDAAV